MPAWIALIVAVTGLVIGANVVRQDGGSETTAEMAFHRVKNTSLTGTQNGQTMAGITFVGGEYIAVGRENTITDGTEYVDGAVWVSQEGRNWNKLPHDPINFGGVPRADGQPARRSMEGIAHGNGQFIAVGFDSLNDSEFDAAVWASKDGHTWSKIPHQVALGGNGHQAMYGVSYGQGKWIAVGRDSSRQDGDAVVWVSADGVTWDRVEQSSLGGPLRQELNGISFAQGGWLAVGSDTSTDKDHNSDDAAVWKSKDGRSWSRVGHGENSLGGSGIQAMHDVAWVGDRYVAVGVDDSTDRRTFDGAAWTSRDGEHWTLLAYQEDLGGVGWQYVMGILFVDAKNEMIAVGTENVNEVHSTTSRDAAVWLIVGPVKK